MRQFQCVHTTYVFSINELFTMNFLKTDSQLFSLFQWNEHVEKNKFSCSLSYTLMTVIDYSLAHLLLIGELIVY